MNIRVAAEDAGWTIREAAWDFEERVVWPASDACGEALEPARRAIAPLQKLIQTRFTWPLADALHRRNARTRRAFAAVVAASALAAAAAGAISAPHHHPAESVTGAAGPAPVGLQAGSATQVLQGVAPKFEPARAPAPAPQPPAKSSAPPAQVAWQFAQAFVGYEVGRSGEAVQEAFHATATKQLAKALAADPPRLPAKGKVPRARVLNVVLGAPAKNQVTASVSLVRLRAISELRLTLTKAGDAWRVAQVLG